MAQTPQKRSKQRGYEVEKQFEAALQSLFPTMQRMGSIHYYKDAPDLQTEDGAVVVQCKGLAQTWIGSLWRDLNRAAPDATMHLVCTKDKRGKLLVTFEMEELNDWITRLARSSFEEGVLNSG